MQRSPGISIVCLILLANKINRNSFINMDRFVSFGLVSLLVFSTLAAALYSEPVLEKNILSPNFYSNISKSIVYILPHERCSDYWTRTYGDRIYYYAYENISADRKFIEKDFEIISGIYDRVIVVVPAEDSQLYFNNMKIIDEIATEMGLQTIYAIFPGEKYGREDSYLEAGSEMHNLVIGDMQYLSSLTSTYKVAIWYGWTYRCNAEDIADFYLSIPDNLKEKYAVWLDEEYAERVRDVYLYGLPTTVLFITEAYDVEEIKSYSCLYYNQMLVTGYEGASSLQEWSNNINEMLSFCKCKNVGIWIFYDIGDGAGEEYAAFIDGKLSDFNWNYNISRQKGFSYAAWWNDSYLTPDSDASLENLRETGTEYVSLITTWYQADEHSTQIFSDKNSTPSDEAIIHAIQAIHSLGMKVMLKPHVDLYNGEWRGEIYFDNEREWEEWFESYRNFICHYAKLAEENGVEQFCVGCELVKTVGREEWFDIIKDVRKNFSGLITYAADWSNYWNVTFWNALDFIGIDAYFGLTEKNDPSMEELMNGWKRWKYGIEGIHNSTSKPIVFTEIGYRSIDGCNRDPWNWQRHGRIDLQEQADCYLAAFKTFWNESWFNGFYWWMWWANTSIGGSNDDSYTPYKKPAENVLKTYYLELNVSVEIEKPQAGHLYIFDRDIAGIGKTIIIGRITIVANASNAEKVEFYINDELRYVDESMPYSWVWDEFTVGNYEIKVIAYGDDSKAEDELRIIKIF